MFQIFITFIVVFMTLIGAYFWEYNNGFEAVSHILRISSSRGEILMAVNDPDEEITDVNDAYDYIFVHECLDDDCTNMVEYDDEPWCFEHSPDQGSSVQGYSARRQAQKELSDGS